jgi:hypothetical protein
LAIIFSKEFPGGASLPVVEMGKQFLALGKKRIRPVCFEAQRFITC